MASTTHPASLPDREALLNKEAERCKSRAQSEAKLLRLAAGLLIIVAIAFLCIRYLTDDDRASADLERPLYWTVSVVSLGVLVLFWSSFRVRRAIQDCEYGRRAPELDSTLDINLLITEHGDPSRDGSVASIVEEELRCLERLARRKCLDSEKSANHWWLVRYWLGSFAALFAGLAGVSALTDIGGGWKVAIGIVALLGSALVGVTTTLNPQKGEQQARTMQAEYVALATKARLLREFGPATAAASNSPSATKADVFSLYNELQAVDRGLAELEAVDLPPDRKQNEAISGGA